MLAASGLRSARVCEGLGRLCELRWTVAHPATNASECILGGVNPIGGTEDSCGTVTVSGSGAHKLLGQRCPAHHAVAGNLL
mmetsp:Transcript_68882/g.152430  ORF Transcript_68882/g.152430 Transcript_68882/m.152430 type:complete len:81 (+) Transcript_68882:45-287(+)